MRLHGGVARTRDAFSVSLRVNHDPRQVNRTAVQLYGSTVPVDSECQKGHLDYYYSIEQIYAVL
jgi:hypothetical protein